MRKLEKLGASSAIFLYKLKSEELDDIYSLTEEKSNYVYLSPSVYDANVHIPSITLSRYGIIALRSISLDTIQFCFLERLRTLLL